MGCETFSHNADSDEDTEMLIPESSAPHPASYSQRTLKTAFIITLLALILTLFALASRPARNSLHDTYSHGFLTEFGPARQHVRLRKTQFWGGPRWHDNGTGYTIHEPKAARYTGPPSDAIESAWHGLLSGRYFSISEAEAVEMFGVDHGLSDNPSVGLSVGIDVLHALHCVNELRKALDREHYFGAGREAYPERYHRDHCLDHVRQLLMCNADLTPIPVVYYPGYGRDFVQSDVVHTCRDWDALSSWVDERNVITEKVVEGNYGRQREPPT